MERNVRFIPIKHGDVVDLGSIGVPGVSGNHKIVGFKPGRAGKREGWIVILVDPGVRRPRCVRKKAI